jgi:hypothetical protein
LPVLWLIIDPKRKFPTLRHVAGQGGKMRGAALGCPHRQKYFDARPNHTAGNQLYFNKKHLSIIIALSVCERATA